MGKAAPDIQAEIGPHNAGNTTAFTDKSACIKYKYILDAAGTALVHEME